MRPIIGIAGNEVTNPDKYLNGMSVNYTPHDFVNVVFRAGGLPLIIPIGQEELAAQYVDRIDGLILAGGQDVSPSLYGEEASDKAVNISLRRDKFEMALIEETMSQNKPIFGVCRGMQILNVSQGGTLYQDITDIQVLDHVQDEVFNNHNCHKVDVKRSSILYSALGDQIEVNSYHHQAIKKVSPYFKITARSEDGFIEAIEAANSADQVVAVQWHPEVMSHQNPAMQQLFDDYIKRVIHSKRYQITGGY